MNEQFQQFNDRCKHSVTQALSIPEFAEQGVELYVKRDDLIHPFVSGNKWRKLKHYILDFYNSGAKGIVTYGGAYSNHLLATAVACAHFGIPVKGIVRGNELHASSNHILKLCDQFGMKLQFVDRGNYAQEKTRMGLSGDEYFIREGGGGKYGWLGCNESVDELNQDFDHILVAVGTGTTVSGIADGCLRRGIKTKVHGIVVLKGAEDMDNNIAEHCRAFQLGSLNIHHQYHYGGFAKYDKAQLDFNRSFSAKTGVLLDPVYTGKMFRACFDMLSNGVFLKGERVLCYHTGGLTGILSDKFLKN